MRTTFSYDEGEQTSGGEEGLYATIELSFHRTGETISAKDYAEVEEMGKRLKSIYNKYSIPVPPLKARKGKK